MLNKKEENTKLSDSSSNQIKANNKVKILELAKHHNIEKDSENAILIEATKTMQKSYRTIDKKWSRFRS